MRLPVAVLTLSTFAVPALRGEGPKPEELEWLRKSAVPLKTAEAGNGFDDLEPFRSMVGDARIVSLGEGTHGTREFFQMKHRLTEFLATEMGFTIFSIEANMPEAYRLNDYVLHGRGDPRELISGMYFWTWDTKEVLEMVKWMREFNKAGKGRVEFTGFDMQTPDVAMGIVLDFLKSHDSERHRDAQETYGNCVNAPFRMGAGSDAFGVATGRFPVEAAKGKKVRFSGWIKTQGVTGYAGLWWRADGEKGVLAFDNMQRQNVRGDTDWKRYEISLDVPDTVININFGVLMPGSGKAWFDDLSVEIDGKVYNPGEAFDFGFEKAAIIGLATPVEGYRVALDANVSHSGKQSLCIEAADADSDEKKLDAKEAARLCGDVVAAMELKREEYAKSSSEKDADWAIQNARVVHQCMQMHANEITRDESMAKNVKWILDHAPAGAKIVLWAHNGHVHRLKPGQMGMGGGAQGGFLDDWYGTQQLVVGFAAGEGHYTAIAGDKGLVRDNALRSPTKASYEAYFRAASIPMFMLDLRKSVPKDPASGWLRRTRSFRFIGAMATDAQFSSANLCELYDVMIYFDQTTASQAID